MEGLLFIPLLLQFREDLGEGQSFFIRLPHIPQDKEAVIQFIFTHNECKIGILPVGIFHLRFHGSPQIIHRGGEPFFTDIQKVPKSPLPGLFTEGNDIDIHRFFSTQLDAKLFAGDKKTLDSCGKTNSRGRLPSDLLDQQIVTPPSGNGILGAQIRADQFEGGLCVVIHTTDQIGIFLIGDSQILQVLFNLLIMLLRIFTEVIGDNRRRLNKWLVFLFLGVQNPEWIIVITFLLYFAQLLVVRLQMGFQSFFIHLPAGWIPYGVQFQDGVCDSYFPENMNHKRDRFCICYRIAAADNFKSKLMELSLPSPLGSFGPEHGADVVELLGAATLVEMMLYIGTNHGSRQFRTKNVVIVTSAE